MKFIIQTIDSSLSMWNPGTNHIDEKTSLIFSVELSDNFRMDIGDDFILCGSSYFEKNINIIGGRKKIDCSIVFHSPSNLDEEFLTNKYLGFGQLNDGELDISIYLNSQKFNYLNSQIGLIKKQNDLYMTFESCDGQSNFQSCIDGHAYLSAWNTSKLELGNLLGVKSLEMGFNLYQNKT